MTQLKGILWFFPLLFIFHDFEEIIFMKSWLNKSRGRLTKRFPTMAPSLYGHFDRITAEAFAKQSSFLEPGKKWACRGLSENYKQGMTKSGYLSIDI